MEFKLSKPGVVLPRLERTSDPTVIVELSQYPVWKNSNSMHVIEKLKARD